MLRLALHLLRGLATVALIYPFSSHDTHKALRQRWSSALLAILDVRLDLHGSTIRPDCMLVANHVSWLDIFAINAATPSAFVSKSEVREWPLIGWLAARNDTVFLRRGSRGHARLINAEIATLLDAGHNVAIFPEGTTTDGTHVLHFHSALLQPAIAAGHAIQPIAIRYLNAEGAYSRAPAYDGDISLGQCLLAIVREPGLIVSIDVAAPLTTDDGIGRRALAQRARETIIAHVVASDHDAA